MTIQPALQRIAGAKLPTFHDLPQRISTTPLPPWLVTDMKLQMEARVVDLNPLCPGFTVEHLNTCMLVRWLRHIGFTVRWDNASTAARPQIDRTCGVVAARTAALLHCAGCDGFLNADLSGVTALPVTQEAERLTGKSIRQAGLLPEEIMELCFLWSDVSGSLLPDPSCPRSYLRCLEFFFSQVVTDLICMSNGEQDVYRILMGNVMGSA